MSYIVEVQTDSSRTWTSNKIAFSTRKEAEEYAANLEMRWTAVRATRVIEGSYR